jgi:hypothetical protein
MDYPYIRAWGRMIGSKDYYITMQIEQARQDAAPNDATYKSSDGHWHTIADVTREDTRALLNDIVSGGAA